MGRRTHCICLSVCITLVVLCEGASDELLARGIELLHGSGATPPNPTAAEVLFRQSIQQNPQSAASYNNLAVALQEIAITLPAIQRRSTIDEAIEQYRISSAIKPQFQSYLNMAALLEDTNSREGHRMARHAAKLAPHAPEACTGLANFALHHGSFGQAHRFYTRALRLKRGVNNNHGLSPNHATIGRGSLRDQNRVAVFGTTLDGRQLISICKLRHDFEQLEYQLASRLVPSNVSTELKRLGETIARMSTLPAEEMDGIKGLAAVDQSVVLELNRLSSQTQLLVLEPPTSVLPWRAVQLKTAQERVKIQRQYFDNAALTSSSSVITVDNLLVPQVLQKLRLFALGSNVFHEQKTLGYLGSQMDDGFSNPLLFQIGEELRELLPSVFKGHQLRHAWAYKYDSELEEGIEAHADQAAVNVNVWITPDSENLSEGHGGLVIYRVAAPSNWGFQEFNNRASRPKIRALIASDNDRNITVPYKANRAVIFDSSLLHQTDKFKFRQKYASRRINVTLLFGKKVRYQSS